MDTHKKEIYSLERACIKLEEHTNMGVDEWVLQDKRTSIDDLIVARLKILRQAIATSIVQIQEDCEKEIVSHSPMKGDEGRNHEPKTIVRPRKKLG